MPKNRYFWIMHTFEELSTLFSETFEKTHFPKEPQTLYEPNNYFLSLGGKRLRPVLCLMANELFGDIHPDAWNVATAIELFHNFTLIHDDIMDKAPLRRGRQTVHSKYSESTAILAGDVMMIRAYEYISRIDLALVQRILELFNHTAVAVCEGQQLDMDYEQRSNVTMEEYLEMITQKTSVLLAASLQMGGILGGGSYGNLDLLYQAGKKIGLAFQVQDDYLDAFGDPEKFGKQAGGDILANKKTFLLIKALEDARGGQKEELDALLAGNDPDKVNRVLDIYRSCKIDDWAIRLKHQFLNEALRHFDDMAVVSKRKLPLKELAQQLVKREN
ncbi:geranylgeranyl diphosphate synthase, type II [Niabella drilacis]|uniref:Geranylgeranyl diphosphate synthase, type II n=2 Tax=Niabella drilacis (strain DSM 25811 / CCM 8410 / CCUG 62505 / LMG 26954 / E90) TaxID=1285928 RepID=A0A1G6YCR5_NIADE|nr:geranylgeranyl diphosphate synthase, type II [Niabella drilacis]